MPSPASQAPAAPAPEDPSPRPDIPYQVVLNGQSAPTSGDGVISTRKPPTAAGLWRAPSHLLRA